MNPMPNAQEQARRFNENEAIRRCFELKRRARKPRPAGSPLTDHMLDDLDWREAVRECRSIRAIGKAIP